MMTTDFCHQLLQMATRTHQHGDSALRILRRLTLDYLYYLPRFTHPCRIIGLVIGDDQGMDMHANTGFVIACSDKLAITDGSLRNAVLRREIPA